MKYFKFTINRRDYKLAIDDILFIQVSKEKIHMVKVVTADKEYHIYHQLKDIEREYHFDVSWLPLGTTLCVH